jgi:hypothetical protein
MLLAPFSELEGMVHQTAGLYTGVEICQKSREAIDNPPGVLYNPHQEN